MRVGWKVHMMASYLLLITLIQELQHHRHKYVDYKEAMLKTKPHKSHSMRVSGSAYELFSFLFLVNGWIVLWTVSHTPFFEGVSSEHRIVSAMICLSLCKNTKQTVKALWYDWSSQTKRDVSNQYMVTVRNKFDVL